MTPVLITERLLLRPFEHEDARGLSAIMSDPLVARGVCSSPLPFTPLHAAARILMMLAAEGRGDLAWAIEDQDGALIGLITLASTSPNGPLELGIALASSIWGQGYAREALAAVFDWQDRAKPGQTVVIEVFADTPAAIALATDLGFVRTGSSTRYSLARDCRDPVEVFGRTAA